VSALPDRPEHAAAADASNRALAPVRVKEEPLSTARPTEAAVEGQRGNQPGPRPPDDRLPDALRPSRARTCGGSSPYVDEPLDLAFLDGPAPASRDHIAELVERVDRIGREGAELIAKFTSEIATLKRELTAALERPPTKRKDS
jgi:hypothetical protein